MTYDLSKYKVTITSDDSELNAILGESLSIGGEGDAVGEISLSYSNSLYSLKSYATGAWHYDKNLSRAGVIRISLNQLCPQIRAFIRICNLFFNGSQEFGTLTMSISNFDETVATCIACKPSKIADHGWGETASQQSWEFLSGKIQFI